MINDDINSIYGLANQHLSLATSFSNNARADKAMECLEQTKHYVESLIEMHEDAMSSMEDTEGTRFIKISRPGLNEYRISDTSKKIICKAKSVAELTEEATYHGLRLNLDTHALRALTGGIALWRHVPSITEGAGA